jgi:tRNA-splicing ligase RtcB
MPEKVDLYNAAYANYEADVYRQATKLWQGRRLVDELREKGVLIPTRSFCGVAVDASGAYKDVNAVAEAAEQAKLARRVARLVPVICVKG